jgi:arsenate-mycothiol transferase
MTQETATSAETPAVLFVCSKNGGKSQLAAGAVTVYSGCPHVFRQAEISSLST